ncbi:peptide chain release factor N(5)-glutamine methyltransferase [Qipengyuania sp.]|uniref:peptide chain release factor N(5)-glutamine methyltransferase n=1 Tax=Qipengyuania sp. TaxID=2004515 RepID=UPI0035C80EC8
MRDAAERLGVDWARLDAELLMAHALGHSRSDMLLRHMRDPVPAGFATLVERRLADEPVAYIVGEAEFFGRRFAVTPDVLIPRIDSETVVNAALAAAPDPRRVLDCGTGSGCLLLTLLAERSAAEGVGIDRSPAALALAGNNAAALGLAYRTRLLEADWTQTGWADALGRFDLVIANPPYVESGADLDASVRDHEPHGALFAGEDGLDDYRVLIPQLPALLAPAGAAVLEIGWKQADAGAAIAAESGFDVALTRDLAGRPRALTLTFGESGG